MKYYSQYRIHDLFELQESLLGLSKSNRWVKLADRLPWAKIEKEYNKRLRNIHCGAGNKPARMVVGALIVKHVESLSDEKTIQVELYRKRFGMLPERCRLTKSILGKQTGNISRTTMSRVTTAHWPGHPRRTTTGTPRRKEGPYVNGTR